MCCQKCGFYRHIYKLTDKICMVLLNSVGKVYCRSPASPAEFSRNVSSFLLRGGPKGNFQTSYIHVTPKRQKNRYAISPIWSKRHSAQIDPEKTHFFLILSLLRHIHVEKHVLDNFYSKEFYARAIRFGKRDSRVTINC